jgi:hypothetical protein
MNKELTMNNNCLVFTDRVTPTLRVAAIGMVITGAFIYETIPHLFL